MTPSPIPAAAIAGAREAAKRHLRIAGDSEDALIDLYAASGFALCEAFTGRVTIAREWRETLTPSPWWQRLGAGPVMAITVEDAPDGGYAVDIDAEGDGWVRLPVRGAGASVRFTAGLATEWDALPAPIAQGMVLLVAHLFEARAEGAAPPAAVAALWRPWRRMRLDARGRA